MRGPRIVALGDSVTVGVGDAVPPGCTPGWTAHLAALLGGPPPTVLAAYGSRVRDVRVHQVPLALGSGADIATLLVGGNDMLRLGYHAVARARDVADIALELRDDGMLVVVVLLHDPALTLPPWLGDLALVLSARARAMNAELHALLDRTVGVVVVDPTAHAEASSRLLWHTDRMHPSPVGHRLLAQMVAEQLAVHGCPTTGSMSPATRPDTSPLATVGWAVRTGVPWVARRSIDLIPELAAVVLSERGAARAAGARAP